MLKRVGEATVMPCVPMGEAAFPAPFASHLEYSVPARGPWTIVHVGMLMPEAHEIYVCAAGCLRGVVLSAAEMNLTGRFSTVAIEEHNVLDGDMEDLLIEGVADIIERLPYRPKAVQVYSSCIHQFVGSDLEMCYDTLRARFPDIDFIDCYMNPTMRKSGLTPDQIMRRQLYSLIRKGQGEDQSCSILGNCFSIEEGSDIVRLIRSAGWDARQITNCKTYEEYQRMGRSPVLITTQAVARAGGEAAASRLGRRHLYLPVSYGAQEIRANLALLAQAIGAAYDGGAAEEARAEEALRAAKQVIGEGEIAIDYTFTPRPLGLARLLLTHGFRVTTLFIDGFSGEEKADFDWIRQNAPEITLYPTVAPAMRRFPRGAQGNVLALGQKAAYFLNSAHFVNLVENGGLYGFGGIARLAELMIEAHDEEKDMPRLIGQKGLGCESCL